MEIHWKRKNIKDYVFSFAQSNPITARRMNSIKAATSFLDLVCDSNGRAHFLQGAEYEDCFSLDLEKKGNGKRLICMPVEVDENGQCIKSTLKDEKGQYLKGKITEFMVIKVEDYH
jgi:hypothetical protein